jgi:large subunit ribosomal protein L24
MQPKLHIKKGDSVKVIAGNSKGMQGKVLIVETKDYTAIVEGINLVTSIPSQMQKIPRAVS